MMWRIKYALDDSHGDPDYGGDWLRERVLHPLSGWLEEDRGWTFPRWVWRVPGFPSRALCRWRGHPAGVWFYNMSALEPDMRCRGCGEDLG